MFTNLSKRVISLVVAVLMVVTMFAGCGKSEPAATSTSAASSVAQESAKASEAAPVEKTKVDFWYLWGGVEEPKVKSFIDTFNKSQEKFEVVGTYIADMQKVKVAIAGGTGPDITDDFDGNVAGYADQGILEPLDEYFAKDSISFDDYISGAIDICKYNGKTYALPAGVNFFMMYYNKTILAKAGYTEPPKTQKEMLEMAIKTTELNADKSIKVLGFPDFPYVYYFRNMLFASGGNLYNADGKYIPDSPEAISALNLIREYRNKFGVDKVLQFNQSGKYNEATDPFFTGNQTFRFDGPWLADTIVNGLKIGKDKLDYGVCAIPYPEEKPEVANSAQVTGSIFYIPSNAKSKDGAWEVMKFIHKGEFAKAMRGFPVLKSQLSDPLFAAIPNFADFANYAKVGKFAALPANAKQAEVNKILDDQLEKVVTMKATPEEAMKKAAADANAVLGK